MSRPPSISRKAADARTIHEAAGVIRRGGLVAFPTETVYGLGLAIMDRLRKASQGIALVAEGRLVLIDRSTP